MGEEEPHDTEFLARSHQVAIMMMMVRMMTTMMMTRKKNMPLYFNFQVTAIVRKELAVAIRDLMHHGLNQVR